MKKNLLKLLALAAIFSSIACQEEVNTQTPANGKGIEFYAKLDNTSRVAGSQFESGDIAMFDAYGEEGDLHANNVSYSYKDGSFTSASPIYYTSGHPSLTFVACYPATTSLDKSFTFSASEDQSLESSFEQNDLLIAKSELSSEEKPTMEFNHVMSYVELTITSSSKYSDIAVNAKNSALCNIETMRFSATGDNVAITPRSLGSNKYLVLVAPQTIAKGDSFVTATLNGTTYEWRSTATSTLEAGYRYKITCDLSEQAVVEPASTYRAGWAELPSEVEDEGNYYYAYHTATLNSKTVRNLSVCYSDDYTCPVWVAGPMHRSYAQGSGNRRNNYKDDPDIPCYQVETLGSPYNRGHMFASSDRLGNQELNNQAFYLSNIGPQLISGFNSGGGIWNNYEDWIQEEYLSRSDTLYMVNGCHWENTNKVVKGTTVPTHYYKAALRCKTPNSKKWVGDCSRDELECVVFYMEHRSQSGVKPSASHLISVEELEKKIGFTLFANIPNAPKDTFKASDWGL